MSVSVSVSVLSAIHVSVSGQTAAGHACRGTKTTMITVHHGYRSTTSHSYTHATNLATASHACRRGKIYKIIKHRG